MTQQEKASQVLMTGIDGKITFPHHLYSHFEDTVPGAIILFRYNIADSPQQVSNYLQSCLTAFSHLGAPVPVFFAIDNEGGSVFRTSGVTSTLPSAKKIADLFTTSTAQELYRIQGQQLRSLGISMNLAPVAEIQTGENSLFLGTRSYGSDIQAVSSYAKAAILGYRKSNIISVVKHFPGNSNKDPHLQLPFLDVTREKFENNFIAPFSLLFSSVPVDALLVSHIVVPQLDPELPFCLSQFCVTDYLRGTLGFSGLILTDDISMPALSNSLYPSSLAAVMALKAGCDMIMTSATNIREIIDSIKLEAAQNPIFSKRLDSAVSSILYAKFTSGILTTSHQRYSISRYSYESPVSHFDSEEYTFLFNTGNILLEEKHDK